MSTYEERNIFILNILNEYYVNLTFVENMFVLNGATESSISGFCLLSFYLQFLCCFVKNDKRKFLCCALFLHELLHHFLFEITFHRKFCFRIIKNLSDANSKCGFCIWLFHPYSLVKCFVLHNIAFIKIKTSTLLLCHRPNFWFLWIFFCLTNKNKWFAWFLLLSVQVLALGLLFRSGTT